VGYYSYFYQATKMTEVKIMTQTPGLVVFDPVVLADFIASRQVPVPNVLESFSQNPGLGNEAAAIGCLVPIYSIPAWDYRVRITEAARPTVPAEWVLFETPSFVLQVTSGRVLVSDSWAMLNWEADTYLTYGSQPIAASYAAANEFKATEAVPVPNGRYQVTVVGFCDQQNPDVETRPCGYELLLARDEQAVSMLLGSIDNLDLEVVKLP
jgi:hypothetical protein